jgi:hypothetical protein
MKKLVKLALIGGGIVMVAKLVSAQKSAWAGLTESEVREKLDARLPARIPDDKRAAIAEMVVSRMRERGVIREESESSTPPGGDTETTF